MKRYGRGGWFGESHRHYLAGKGITTKRYYSDAEKKQGFLDKYKMTVASNAPDAEMNFREDVANKKENEIREEMMRQTDERKIDPINMQPLWNDFEKEKEIFLQTGDVFMFNNEVDRKVKSHLASNQRSLSFGDMIEAEK